MQGRVVFQCVSQQDFSKRYGSIFMKFGKGGVALVQEIIDHSFTAHWCGGSTYFSLWVVRRVLHCRRFPYTNGADVFPENVRKIYWRGSVVIASMNLRKFGKKLRNREYLGLPQLRTVPPLFRDFSQDLEMLRFNLGFGDFSGKLLSPRNLNFAWSFIIYICELGMIKSTIANNVVIL